MPRPSATWIALALLAAVTVVVSNRALWLGPAALEHVGHHLDARPVTLWVHMLVASLAMVLTPVQFLHGLRARRPGLHRMLGRICIAAILIGGISAVPLSATMQIPLSGRVGHIVAAIGWMATALIAARRIAAGDVAAHRLWMALSAAFTYSAATLRLELPLFRALGLGLADAHALASWTGWSLNLALVAWLYRDNLRLRGAAVV